MGKNKFEQKLLRPAQIIFGLALFVAVSGCISYFTANGHAVIGPDFASLTAQKAIIKEQTISYSLSLAGLSLVLFTARYFLLHKRD